MDINIFGSIVDAVTGLLDTVRKGIDDVHTSDEEKSEAKRKLAKIEQSVYERASQLQSQIYSAQESIIVAEAQGESWLQRSWRPITMLTFLAMLLFWWIANIFGFIPPEQIPTTILAHVFDLMQIGIGGYIFSRGVEKTADKVAPIFRDGLRSRSQPSETTNGVKDDESPTPSKDRALEGNLSLRPLPPNFGGND